MTNYTYTITTSANPSNGGTTSGGGTFNHGQSCTVHATSASGYNFVNWTENGNEVSTQDDYTFNVTANRSLVANFGQDTYTVTTLANPNNGGTTSGGGIFIEGQSSTVRAVASPCYTFTSWTENNQMVSRENPYTFTVTNDHTLVANFTLLTFDITADIEPADGGIVVGTGAYDCGDVVTLTAIPNTNYSFVGWFENGIMFTDDLTMAFAANANRHFTAHFAHVQSVDETESSLMVYPNPTDGLLHIEGPGIKHVMVFNALGQTMENIELENQNMVLLNTDSYEAGVYILQIETEQGVFRKHFIKR